MRPPPAWQCYASDWLASEHFRLASLGERGLLWTMLNQVWVSDSLPSDSAELAQLFGLSTEAVSEARTNRVMSAFTLEANDRLTCPELKALKDEYLARKSERSAAGRKGAKQRWDKRKEAMAKPSTSAMASHEMRRAEQRGAEVRPITISKKVSEEEEIESYRRAFGEV